MKSIVCCAVLLGSLVSLFGAAGLIDNPSSEEARVEYDQSVEKGPSHALRTFVQSITDEFENITLKTNRYTELQAGMHYWEDNQWKESQEIIEIFKDGAVARKGQHKVIFSPNINTIGALDMEMQDGKRLRSHLVGLAYYDSGSGKSAIIAEMKDSIGQLVAANQIVYADAFNDIKADVRYEWTKGGLEQDVILLEIPPLPEEFGLVSATTRLEVWTEYIDPPQPSKRIYPLRQEMDGIKRQQMTEPDLVDEMLDFGAMSTAAGRAFLLMGERQQSQGELAPTERVATRWTKIEQRDFLIEAIEYPMLQERFQALLKQGAKLEKPRRSPRPSSSLASIGRTAPARRNRSKLNKPILAARTPYSANGFVIDYIYVNTTTNLTFRKGFTYYLSSGCTLSGTTTFEDGTVLKYAPSVPLTINGPIVCKTTMYRPAILTARDDNSAGETLAESTGTLSGYYGSPMLSIYTTNNYTLSDLRIKYGLTAIACQSSVSATFKNFQIVGTQNAINSYYSQFHAQNGLLSSNVWQVSPLSGGTFTAENVTFGRIIWLIGSSANIPTPILTNCVLSFRDPTGYSGSNTYSGTFNREVTNSDFVVAGGGNYYLPGGSSLKNAGTTNISGSLLADLKKKTTAAPVLISGQPNRDLRLHPVVSVDTDALDLGYHYDPADYFITNATITKTLTIDPGTTILFYGNGLALSDGANVSGIGSPTNLILLTNYKNVQDAALNNAPSDYSFDTSSSTNSAINLDLQFCKVETPQVMKEPKGVANFRNSSFFGQQFFIQRNNGTLGLNFTNCLFEYTSISGNLNSKQTAVNFYNCNFTGAAGSTNFGGMAITMTPNVTWTVKDSIFDGVPVDVSSAIHNYNAYLSGYPRLQPPASNDVVVASISYDTGPLGTYYLPSGSSFINAGSHSADAASLYHFTTSTNQTKETTSTVDLGFHYVVLNGSNSPVDTDGDGLPDYFEDTNGNNSVDANETDWNSATDAIIKVLITRPKGSPSLP